MMKKLKELFEKYRSIILYVIFGGLTTVVDFVICYLLYWVGGELMEQSRLIIHAFDIVGWIAAVLFAFITNRIWVFESKKTGVLPVLGELASFAGGRVFTFLLQEGIVFLFYNVLEWNAFLVRAAAAVLVVILNYFISKFFVFKKK